MSLLLAAEVTKPYSKVWMKLLTSCGLRKNSTKLSKPMKGASNSDQRVRAK